MVQKRQAHTSVIRKKTKLETFEIPMCVSYTLTIEYPCE